MAKIAIRAGGLRHRAAIESVTSARDVNGGFSQSWATDATVWASIKQLNGRELETARQMDNRATHEVMIRFHSGLNTKQRFVINSKNYNIASVNNVDDRSVFQKCLVFEDGA